MVKNFGIVKLLFGGGLLMILLSAVLGALQAFGAPVTEITTAAITIFGGILLLPYVYSRITKNRTTWFIWALAIITAGFMELLGFSTLSTISWSVSLVAAVLTLR